MSRGPGRESRAAACSGPWPPLARISVLSTDSAKPWVTEIKWQAGPLTGAHGNRPTDDPNPTHSRGGPCRPTRVQGKGSVTGMHSYFSTHTHSPRDNPEVGFRDRWQHHGLGRGGGCRAKSSAAWILLGSGRGWGCQLFLQEVWVQDSNQASRVHLCSGHGWAEHPTLALPERRLG